MSGLAGTDAGPSWTTILGVNGETVESSDASATPLVITDAPGYDKRIVLNDLELSSDSDMWVTLRTTGDQTVLGEYPLSANSTIKITTRGEKKAPLADRTLEVLTDGAGNITATALYHLEPASPCAPVADFTASSLSITNDDLETSQFDDSESYGTISSVLYEYQNGGTGWHPFTTQSTTRNPLIVASDIGSDTMDSPADIRLTVIGPGGRNTKTRSGYIAVTSGA